MRDKLDRILSHYNELRQILADPEVVQDTLRFAKLSKEYASLGAVADQAQVHIKLLDELADVEVLLKEPTLDKEMQGIALAEKADLMTQLAASDHAIRVLLLPKDEDDERNAILEIRAGTGGDEAALFGADLLRMYQRYAEENKWRVELLSLHETGIGGVKEASIAIAGKNVFARLKYESGVHRVQRVPETEASGRIHTSAATVAVLAEVQDVEIDINEEDLRIDTYRASGAGGQHVNKTESAVRITHLPTGVVVQQQDEKSQHKNKAKAMKILRAKLYEAERERQHAQQSAKRKSQVGSGDRSERIRTYNYPQGRVTDHRINLTLYKLNAVLNGEALDELVDALVAEDQAAKLAASVEE